MQHRRSVALLVETSNAYARRLLEGILDYVHRHRGWSIYLPEQDRGASPPAWLSRWRGDGIIARVETEEVACAVRQTRLPAVDVSAARLLPEIPWVETNDEMIGAMGADHLLQRGFQNLAFCGDPGYNWSVWRESSFRQNVTSAGAAYFAHQSISQQDPKYSWNNEKRRLIKWINKLPRPVGIMACYDIKAQQLLDVCRELDVAVPEQIAVLGVDNDRLLCDLAEPPLSSVIPNAHRSGYLAAELLDGLMQGQEVSLEAHLIDPIGIETRQSTDVLAIDDPEVAVALRFIRERAMTGIDVSDVLREIPLSRRVLEARFRQLLKRTPHQEIMRVRVEQVRMLLANTDFTLAEIAIRAGFEHAEYLSVVFKRETGMTPTQYRKSLTSSE